MDDLKSCRLYIEWGGGPRPVEGDILLSNGGSAYRIDRIVSESPARSNYVVLRLGRGAVEEGDEGVWPFVWNSRRRRT